MTYRFTRKLPDGVTLADQVTYMVDLCDDMIRQTDWAGGRGTDAVDRITAKRLTRFLVAAKERLQTIPADADQSVWESRDMQALSWALGVETDIDFEEGL